MEDIKVGEYVRTIDGYIRKVIQVNEKGSYENLCYGTYSVDKTYKNSQGISAKKIKSHSPNIIDLIEKNDIGIMSFNGVIIGKFITEDDIIDLKIGTYKLLQIATKEQFNSVKYEV